MPIARDGKSVDQIFAEGDEIDQAMREAFAEVVRTHKRDQRLMVVWRDGQVCHVSPEEFEEQVSGS